MARAWGLPPRQVAQWTGPEMLAALDELDADWKPMAALEIAEALDAMSGRTEERAARMRRWGLLRDSPEARERRRQIELDRLGSFFERF